MAGRKPIPTAIKIQTGNPGHRPLNAHEPKAPVSRLTVPKFLKSDKVASAEYKRLGKQLLDAGVMTVLDETALTIYVTEYTRWLKAEAKLKAEGDTLVTDKGYHYVNPAFAVARQAKDTMMRILTEFGMTPSARSRIKAMPKGGGLGAGFVDQILDAAGPVDIEAARAWTPPKEVGAVPEVG